MRLAVLLVGIGASTFMLRVLVAFIGEFLQPAPRGVQSYLARYQPGRSRRKLVVIRADVSKSRFSAVAWGRIILGALMLAGLVVPLRGQSMTSGTATAEVQGAAREQRVPPEVIQELEAMKKRIEELEAQLKREGRGVDADAASEAVAVPHAEPSIRVGSTNPSPSSQAPPDSAALIPTENSEDRKTLDFLRTT